jgi:TPP-dependent pyruvate/acetoin dehydrogenase alpha subunit
LSDAAHRLQALPSRPEAQLAGVLETAIAHKRRKGSLVQAYIRSQISVEAWQEALRMVARRRLPLIFVCHTGAGQPHAHDYESLAQASQTPHIHVDSGDALAVYRVVQEATGRARRGLGSTLIECRLDASAESVASDAFADMERHLAAKGVFSVSWKDEIEAAFSQELETVLRSAERHTNSRAENQL